MISSNISSTKNWYDTIFVIDWEAFVWVVMPFGVNKGPPTYQVVINKAFKNYIDLFMKIFPNDFCMFSNMNIHMKNL
jgi:hypothetical protein